MNQLSTQAGRFGPGAAFALLLAGGLASGNAQAQLCNGGTTVTGSLTVSADCYGGNTKPLTMGSGANVTVNTGINVTNDAGSGRNGDPISVLLGATGTSLTNYGNIATGQQWAITNFGTIDSLVNYGSITAGVRRAVVNANSTGVITTLTNVGSITGPFADITNNTGSVIGTLNNLQGAAAVRPLSIAGTLPNSYNVIIRSPTDYGQLRNAGAAGNMAFNIYGNTGTTLVPGVAASSVSARTYAGVLQGFTTLAGISGTSGTYTAYSYSLVADANLANAWNLVLTAIPVNYLGSARIWAESQGAPAITALNGMIDTSANSGAVLALNNYLGGLTANALAPEIAKLTPTQSVGVAQGTMGFSSGSFNIVSGRLAATRGDTAMGDATGYTTGAAAGDSGRPKGVWMKGFGSDARQAGQDAFDGYKSTTAGLALGADTDLPNGLRVGAAFTYAQTGVNVTGVHSGDNSKIHSYQLTGYGGKSFGSAYLDAMLAYGRNKYDTLRAVPAGMSAAGHFAGSLWSSRIEAGVRLPLAGRFNVIPLASLTWNRLNIASYAETGGGGASLGYGDVGTTSLKSGIGARFTTVDAINHWRPELHVLWNHEFRNRRVDTSASYAGGTAFVTPGMTVVADSVNIGGGVTYAFSASKSINLAYDYEGRSGYASNAVKATGRWEF